jgi:hypothetical protein
VVLARERYARGWTGLCAFGSDGDLASLTAAATSA